MKIKIRSISRVYLKKVLSFLYDFLAAIPFGHGVKVHVESDGPIPDEVRAELLRRTAFFLPGGVVCFEGKRTKFPFGRCPRLILGIARDDASVIFRICPNVYFIDWRVDHQDGADWCRLANYRQAKNVARSCKKGRRLLSDKVREIKETFGTAPAYLFGTGPSLELSRKRDWSDGVRIVCNTIVRDPVLWAHLSPNFIVAGDTIYHFGANEHSAAFQTDLENRLKETDTLFVYPALFDPIVQRRLSSVKEKLVPIPIGSHKSPIVDLVRRYALPELGNVLNLLLIPVASTITKDIRLWGFDGRDPEAKYFWRNSGRHAYKELMAGIREQHPAFFEHMVPESNPNSYVQNVHGLELESALAGGEAAGFRFEMLHPSWTQVLNKRYLGKVKVDDYSAEILESVSTT